MQCTYPPPLTPDELSAAIDGSAEPVVYDHLAGCEQCARRLDGAQKAERRLSRQLYRWDCPTPAQLGEYHLGGLPAQAAASITEHLAQCPTCSDELRTLRVFLATEASPTQIQPKSAARAERPSLGEVVAQLLSRPGAFALRGETREPLVAETEGVLIILDIQPADKGRVTVLGQVAADAQEQWTSALVQLRLSGELQAMSTVSDLGTFRCKSVSPGTAEIRITPLVGRTIVVPDIKLTARPAD